MQGSQIAVVLLLAASQVGASVSSPSGPDVRSNVALVLDEGNGRTLYAKNAAEAVPIASITKLMTAMVVLDAALPLDELIAIDRADVDRIKHTRSRLEVGWHVARGDLLRVALMSSDNRAAGALGRTYPGGAAACVAAMNRKAGDLGMALTRFTDTTGLSTGNVASAEDLARMVRAASNYPPIREATATWSHTVRFPSGFALEYHNSNLLVRNEAWSIALSKTGYLNEAGRCLVMLADVAARPVIIVLLDSWGTYTRLGDANRIRKWIEATLPAPAGNARVADAAQAARGSCR